MSSILTQGKKMDLISFRLTSTLRKKLERAAERENRSLSNFIVNVLSEKLDPPKKPTY